MPDFIGRDIGRYHIIIQPLGQGGMAAVYKAYDKRLEWAVAIKFIRADPVVHLQRPAILKVPDFGEFEGTLCNDNIETIRR